MEAPSGFDPEMEVLQTVERPRIGPESTGFPMFLTPDSARNRPSPPATVSATVSALPQKRVPRSSLGDSYFCVSVVVTWNRRTFE